MMGNQTRQDIATPWMDTSVWGELKLRDDDIIIASYPRSGTTWVQQIMKLILFPQSESVDIWRHSPWMEQLQPNALKIQFADAIAHRRFFKSHAPFDCLPRSASASYIYVARDGRDVARSTYDTFYLGTRKLKGRPAVDFRTYFQEWLQSPGGDLPYFEHVRSWWSARRLDNVKLLHHRSLKLHLEREVRDLASFVGVDPDALPLQDTLEKCTFAHMKANAAQLLPGQESYRPGVGQYMIFKGENERWRDVLTPADSSAYDELACRELGEECARWLAEGAELD
jgi:aryl sulfotransferase